MTYYRTDKETGEVSEIDKEELYVIMERNYKDADTVMDVIDTGQTVETNWAYYSKYKAK